MTTEIRRSEQRNVLKQQPKGKFWLLYDDVCVDIIAIRDISPNGISVQVARRIENFNDVRVKYQNEMIDMMFNGVVIWHSTNKETDDIDKPYQVGINLISSNMLYTLLR